MKTYMNHRIERIEAKFVDFIPSSLEGGVLYVSQKYKTASHLCSCGCGNKVVTPLKPGGWTLANKNGEVSLNPSIGNWSFPCKSHYWIRSSRIVWAQQWSQKQIEAGRRSDQLAREQYFGASRKEGVWRRITRWIFGR
jgi:Family of unknown function (DUF6527)